VTPIPIVRTVAGLRAAIADWRALGLRVALVPTMGALHEGHLSLVRIGLSRADRVVASIFVNPTQFAPHEDLAAYPRDEAGDAAKLAGAGCHLLFAPAVSEIYRPGAATVVTVSGVSEPLDGEVRPGHFAGVATVVAKLLNQARPDVAVFGEKDYQQLQVIRRLAIDLDLGVEIIGAPTARADDGLALSSRNVYLSAEERGRAPQLAAALADAVGVLRAGARVETAEASARARLIAAGFGRIDYLEVRDAVDLSRLGPGPLSPERAARILAAVQLGRARLIDNMAV
jgi:pantoate--beta-alanine ligase